MGGVVEVDTDPKNDEPAGAGNTHRFKTSLETGKKEKRCAAP